MGPAGTKRPKSLEVERANILYHSKLASEYAGSQPHFRPENVARIDSVLGELAVLAGGKALLDVGCGTGFVMDLAKNHFRQVVGIDITAPMIRLAKQSEGARAVIARASNLPFKDGSFDVCTTFSVLHHLHDLGAVVREIHRVLRPGGVFFSDQDHNYWYGAAARLGSRLSAREGSEREYYRSKGLDWRTVELAEYQALEKGGFKVGQLVNLLRANGFGEVSIRYRWFAGQKFLSSSVSQGAGSGYSSVVNRLPGIRALLGKYLIFTARKNS